MDHVLNNKWLKFFRKHGCPRQRGSNSLWKHNFPRQMDPSCHGQTWFPHVPSLLEVKSCSPRNFKLVWKFPKITIKLQFPFSLEDLSKPFFFFFFATWRRKWGQIARWFGNFPPRSVAKFPKESIGSIHVLLRELFFFEQVGLESEVKLHVPTPLSSPNGFFITFNWRSHMNKIMTIKKIEHAILDTSLLFW